MRFEHITKTFGKSVIFDDFSLQIEEGKITALLGESGAGKTTLLNVAAGLTTFQGTANFGDCAYVFQESRLLPNLTVEGNLKFVLPKSEWENIHAMLQTVGLGDKGKRYPAQLSGGEAKRVSIARAFLYPAKVMLMDEPFSSLDLSIKRDLIALVVKLWQETGKTVLFVTHDVHEAALLSHRAVVLKKGKIVKELTLDLPLPRDFFIDLPQEKLLVQALL